MPPAIFLDRDGTLNFDHGWITSPSKIELLPGAADAVRAINDAGLLAVLITNQPVSSPRRVYGGGTRRHS